MTATKTARDSARNTTVVGTTLEDLELERIHPWDRTPRNFID